MNETKQPIGRKYSNLPVLNALQKVKGAIVSSTALGFETVLEELCAFLDDVPDSDILEDFLYDDAVSSVIYCIETFENGSVDSTVWCARRNFDFLDQYISRGINETAFSRDFEMRVLRDDLIRSEMQRQTADLLVVETLMAKDPKVGIQKFLQKSEEYGLLDPARATRT